MGEMIAREVSDAENETTGLDLLMTGAVQCLMLYGAVRLALVGDDLVAHSPIPYAPAATACAITPMGTCTGKRSDAS